MWANVGPNRHANEANWLTKFSRILRTVFLAIKRVNLALAPHLQYRPSMENM
jgi:hypothetical protein